MYISALLGLFEAWQGQFAWHHHIDVWRLVPHCLMWCIWCERNARSFKDCERSLLEIKSFFLHTLFEWSVIFSHFSCSSFPIFIDRCTFVSWFVPPYYIPTVLGLTLFLLLIISLRYLSQKKKEFTRFVQCCSIHIAFLPCRIHFPMVICCLIIVLSSIVPHCIIHFCFCGGVGFLILLWFW